MFKTENCTGKISQQDKRIYFIITSLIEFLDAIYSELQDLGDAGEIALNNVWPNCHGLCRALRIHLNDLVEVVDGSLIGAREYYVVSDLKDEVIYEDIKFGIDHSWLKLRNGAVVDPFPAGVYATSPLLFPPFGEYADIFPERVYMKGENCPYAKTEVMWNLAQNIARLLSYFPATYEELSEKLKAKEPISSLVNPEAFFSAVSKAVEYSLTGNLCQIPR